VTRLEGMDCAGLDREIELLLWRSFLHVRFVTVYIVTSDIHTHV
jgi:hypothetical protein